MTWLRKIKAGLRRARGAIASLIGGALLGGAVIKASGMVAAGLVGGGTGVGASALLVGVVAGAALVLAAYALVHTAVEVYWHARLA